MNKFILKLSLLMIGLVCVSSPSLASEADIVLPKLDQTYNIFGHVLTGYSLIGWGMVICVLGMLFGFYEFLGIKKLPVHRTMADVSNTIYETCKTYLLQQGKLLIVLELFIGACIFYYFYCLNDFELSRVLVILRLFLN